MNVDTDHACPRRRPGGDITSRTATPSAAKSTDEDIDLDIDLDKELPCQAEGCDQPAAWRIILTHRRAHGACISALGCHAHHEEQVRQMHDWERRGYGVACKPHSVLCHVTWRPL